MKKPVNRQAKEPADVAAIRMRDWCWPRSRWLAVWSTSGALRISPTAQEMAAQFSGERSEPAMWIECFTSLVYLVNSFSIKKGLDGGDKS